jgi:hypothetical protein
MFLFAKLAWINLHGQSSIEALWDELQSFSASLDSSEKMDSM